MDNKYSLYDILQIYNEQYDDCLKMKKVINDLKFPNAYKEYCIILYSAKGRDIKELQQFKATGKYTTEAQQSKLKESVEVNVIKYLMNARH